jgi:hypothetical protein
VNKDAGLTRISEPVVRCDPPPSPLASTVRYLRMGAIRPPDARAGRARLEGGSKSRDTFATRRGMSRLTKYSGEGEQGWGAHPDLCARRALRSAPPRPRRSHGIHRVCYEGIRAIRRPDDRAGRGHGVHKGPRDTFAGTPKSLSFHNPRSKVCFWDVVIFLGCLKNK